MAEKLSDKELELFTFLSQFDAWSRHNPARENIRVVWLKDDDAKEAWDRGRVQARDRGLSMSAYVVSLIEARVDQEEQS